MVALGWALSVGFVSIGTNAVGWFAIGVNAAGFVAVGLVNAVGVFCFGGVNALGGWGGGGVNGVIHPAFGIGAGTIAAGALLVLRIRSWPRDEPSSFVALARAIDLEESWARVRLFGAGDAGDGFVLRDGDTEVRAHAPAEILRRSAAIGRGARVRVRLRRVADRDERAGYRDAAGNSHEIADIVVERRTSWLRKAFGDRIGVQLAFACAGTIAALVLFAWK